MRNCAFLAVLTGLWGAISTPAVAQSRPNMLWISCEDISPNLGCYGDEYAETPNLDRLADEGARFTRCFSHAGVCAVARSGIITGTYPVSIGSHHMRSRIVPPPYVKCFTEYLRAAGYYCTNRSKTDYNFEAPRTAWDENSRNSTDWKGRSPGQPFFSVINLTISHESRIRADFDELRHDPAEVALPPYIPDTPVARRDRARYYDIITLMDRQVGEILESLEEDGLAKDTVVFFWSDHGEGLPRGKRWVYDSGIRVPMIVRWPGQIEAASVRQDLVCFLDFAPTLLSLAGVDVPAHMRGRVILGAGSGPEPEFLFAHRDRMDEAYDMIRGVRGRRFKYIRNFEPWRSYAQNIDYMNKMPTMVAMRRLHAQGALQGAERLYFRELKPVEELYDCRTDPHEIHNLADSAEHRETLARMRQELEAWQERVGDRGLIPEPLLTEQMRPGGKYQRTEKPEVTLAENVSAGTARATITCPTDGASIAYTTETGDGARWKLYTEPVRVSDGDVIRAIACRLGYRDSRQTRLAVGVAE